MITKKTRNLLYKEIGTPSFGMFLVAARTSLGLTQTEMAEKLGVSKGSICDIEKGRQAVSVSLAQKIAKKAKLSEALAIEYALTDILKKAGLKYKVHIEEIAG